MIAETLLNGRLDAWYEWAILVVISVPVWAPVLCVLLALISWPLRWVTCLVLVLVGYATGDTFREW